jgi:tellurite resistance protein TerC
MAPTMAKALSMMAEKHHVGLLIEDGLSYTMEAAMTKDNNVTLFRYEDMHAWITFTCVFAVLITFDNVILNRNPAALTMKRAVLYTLFWMVMAVGFCVWITYSKGTNAGYMWMSGYLLEWMLSFDNLFVFHMIFSVYGCPDNLKHRPLYLGILGAVVFRLIFIFVGEYLMHAFAFMHLIFGAFLIYTGVQTVTGDEEDEDPSQHPFIVWLQSKVSFVSVYCSHASFFVKVPLNDQGEALIPDEAYIKADESTPLTDDAEAEHARYPVVDFEVANRGHQGRSETRATMLFLVVICLEISDVLFAVDSVSAIVSAVNDLFLAYTSTVFAMLGLRATFFVIDVLVQLFSLLKYGVGLVLVFVGIKLIIGRFYHIPTGIVCLVLFSAIGGSMLASVLKEKYFPDEEEEDVKKSAKGTPQLKIKSMQASPFASPACTPIMPKCNGEKLA